MNRRTLFKKIFGTAAAVVAAPLIPTAKALSIPTKVPACLIPLVRRVMPTLLATDIVGVMPMMGPTGQAFHMTLVETRPVSWFSKYRNRYR